MKKIAIVFLALITFNKKLISASMFIDRTSSSLNSSSYVSDQIPSFFGALITASDLLDPQEVKIPASPEDLKGQKKQLTFERLTIQIEEALKFAGLEHLLNLNIQSEDPLRLKSTRYKAISEYCKKSFPFLEDYKLVSLAEDIDTWVAFEDIHKKIIDKGITNDLKKQYLKQAKFLKDQYLQNKIVFFQLQKKEQEKKDKLYEAMDITSAQESRQPIIGHSLLIQKFYGAKMEAKGLQARAQATQELRQETTEEEEHKRKINEMKQNEEGLRIELERIGLCRICLEALREKILKMKENNLIRLVQKNSLIKLLDDRLKQEKEELLKSEYLNGVIKLLVSASSPEEKAKILSDTIERLPQLKLSRENETALLSQINKISAIKE